MLYNTTKKKKTNFLLKKKKKKKKKKERKKEKNNTFGKEKSYATTQGLDTFTISLHLDPVLYCISLRRMQHRVKLAAN